MEENSKLTAERSLEIIRESIERSQRTITRNSAVPMIWWGVCVFVFSFIIAYLWANHGGPAWNALWAIMWLAGYAGNWMIDKKKGTVPTTFVGTTMFGARSVCSAEVLDSYFASLASESCPWN